MELSKKKFNVRTFHRNLSSIKSFFKFLEKYEFIKTNITKGIRYPKLPIRVPNYLTVDEMKRLLKYPTGDNYMGFRDRLILELFYASGLRISELVAIKLSDINIEDCTIKVIGKGQKSRISIFGKTAQKILRGYLKLLSKESLYCKSNYLFPTRRKTMIKEDFHLSVRRVYGIVKKYLSRVSKNEKLSPHSLRHSFATHLLDNGADLMSVKDLLGHSSLSSTQVYTHVNVRRLKEAYEKAHPYSK